MPASIIGSSALGFGAGGRAAVMLMTKASASSSSAWAHLPNRAATTIFNALTCPFSCAMLSSASLGPLVSIVIGIPFGWFWTTAKGAGSRGERQAPVVRRFVLVGEVAL